MQLAVLGPRQLEAVLRAEVGTRHALRVAQGALRFGRLVGTIFAAARAEVSDRARSLDFTLLPLHARCSLLMHFGVRGPCLVEALLTAEAHRREAKLVTLGTLERLRRLAALV